MLEPEPEPVPVPEPAPVPVPGPPAAGSGTGRSVGKVITGRSGVPVLERDEPDWPPPELAATVDVVAQRVAPKPGTAEVAAHGESSAPQKSDALEN